MRFKRSTGAYGHTPPPVTPYQRAGQVWDERIGASRVQARNWRFMAFGSLALSTVMACGLLWQSRQSRVVPYVVAIDRLGEPRALSEADASYTPTDPQIAWALSKFVSHVRGVSLDPVIARRDWLEAYDFTTQRGAKFLSEYARTSGALTRIGERTVTVQVTSVVRASETSFQVKWKEDAFERGSRNGTSRWTGILTLVRKTPRDADTLRRNPLGIYIDAIDWSREFDGTSETADRATVPAPQPAPQPTSQGQSMVGTAGTAIASPSSSASMETLP
ncbi:conjugal transfer protein TrbF [Novosphingobium kaempferiae]|uniref:conjugal transfer protein TrbF n=1 Tax=Novosphingobium kaempferiae TaxID=2896849 RepID=UPI001E4052D9|nr:conjugal transfer protein TrbF [Novosphingobium kaempferiae]